MSLNEDIAASMGQTVEVIGFGRRLVAYIIDAVILGIIGAIVGACIGFVAALASGASGDAMATVNLLANCIGIVIGLVYFVGFWATTGQTLGKMALGIKVISVDGSPVSWGKAALRYLGYIVSSLVLFIGFIWVAFDPKRQGWHDKIASTYVVRKEAHFSPAENVTFVPSDQGQAGTVILVILLALIPILVLVAIVVIAILLLLGPVVGNVFSNIVENLSTPTP